MGPRSLIFMMSMATLRPVELNAGVGDRDSASQNALEGITDRHTQARVIGSATLQSIVFVFPTCW